MRCRDCRDLPEMCWECRYDELAANLAVWLSDERRSAWCEDIIALHLIRHYAVFPPSVTKFTPTVAAVRAMFDRRCGSPAGEGNAGG